MASVEDFGAYLVFYFILISLKSIAKVIITSHLFAKAKCLHIYVDTSLKVQFMEPPPQSDSNNISFVFENH